MQTKSKKIISIIFAAIIFLNLVPIALADIVTDSPANSDKFQLVPPCTGPDGECGWNDLIVLANRVVIFLVWLSASLATLAFCYAGFLYMTAFGEMGKIEQAHGIFKSAITGLFFVLCGWLIIATILKVLDVKSDVVDTINFSQVEKIQGQPR